MDVPTASHLLDFLGVHSWGRKVSADEYQHRCPLHDDQRASASLNMRNGLWNCFVCGGRNVPSLIGEIHAVSLERAAEIYVTEFGGDEKTWEEIKEWAANREEKPKVGYLNKAALAALPVDTTLEDRGILPETLEKFGVKYHEGKDAVLFPVYSQDMEYLGHFVRAAGRKMGEKGRWSSESKPKRYGMPTGFDRSASFFGLPQSGLSVEGRAPYPAVLVEGPVDVLRVYQAGIKGVVGCLTSHISERQANFLKRAHKVILFLDRDVAGAGGVWRAYSLLHRSVRLYAVMYPDKWAGKDPGDLTESDIRNLFLKDIKPLDRLVLRREFDKEKLANLVKKNLVITDW